MSGERVRFDWEYLEDYLEQRFGVDRARLAASLSAAAALCWISIFGFEMVSIQRAWSRLRLTDDRLSDLSSRLRRDSSELARVADEMRAITRDFDLYRGILEILPQNPGFLRTQRAISEEVETLRQRLSRKLKGRLYIVIDTKANKLYVKNGMTLLWQADCSVGRGGRLIDKVTGQKWEFVTPRGQFHVLAKVENPVWTKPDWAFVEAKQPIPPPDDPIRRVPGELGQYVLNLGDGYLIHGTKDERVLGRAVSHGCVRLGAKDLETMFKTVPLKTLVFIF